MNFTGRINAFLVIERLERMNILSGQNTESVNKDWFHDIFGGKSIDEIPLGDVFAYDTEMKTFEQHGKDKIYKCTVFRLYVF